MDCSLIPGLKEWSLCSLDVGVGVGVGVGDDPYFTKKKKKTAGVKRFVEPSFIILACEEKDTTTL